MAYSVIKNEADCNNTYKHSRADGYVPTRLMYRLICNPRADGYVPTRLMYRLICNLPELSIRIFNPLTSYF